MTSLWPFGWHINKIAECCAKIALLVFGSVNTKWDSSQRIYFFPHYLLCDKTFEFHLFSIATSYEHFIANSLLSFVRTRRFVQTSCSGACNLNDMSSLSSLKSSGPPAQLLVSASAVFTSLRPTARHCQKLLKFYLWCVRPYRRRSR